MDVNTKKILNRIFIACACVILLFNVAASCKVHRITLRKLQTELPLEPGMEFKELKHFLYGARTAGFLTDKDMSPEKNDGQFLGAQFMLAPTTLKLNDTSPEFIILDYETLLRAYPKIRALNAVVVATTPYGKILVKKR